SRTSLTFTPSDYATTQFVTLTAPNDNDMADDTVRITATADGIPNATLGVEIRDIDVQNFDISGAPTAPIAEGSATASFKVNLTIVPTAPVTVYATSNKPTKASVSPESCVISAANFNAGCLFVVTAPQDDDTRDESVTIAVSDMVGNIASRSVAIAVHDDDTQSLDLVGPVAAVTEGAEITFTVRPHWNPVDTMTVNLFSSAPAKLEVSPSMLTFGADWMTPKTVTLRGLQDDDVADVMAMISLSSVVLPAAPAPVAVTVTDDDHQTIQLIPTPAGTTLTMTETQQGGAPSISPLGVRLAFRPGPTETVVVAVTVPTAQAGRLTVTGSPLTFNAGNFSMAQFVTLTAPHVNDQVSPTVTVSATGTGMPGIPVATLPVTITDTDTLNLMVSPAAIGPIGEGAGNATFTVKLTVTPPSAVTPSLAFNGAKLTASACPALASVNDVCTVTVAALQDDDARDDMETITISAAGISMAQTVGVTIDDDDTQAFNVTADGTAPVPNPIVITENVDATPPLNPGEFNTRPFVVRLAFNPLGPVSVTVTPSLSNQVTLSANGSPFAASVTFTLDSSTYATGRTVTVRGTEDLDLVDQNLSLRVSGDATVADAVVNVRKTDDDTQRLVLSAPPCGVPTVRRDPAVSPDPPADTGTSLSVPEGSSRAFCVSLGYEPNVTNTVTLMASAASFGVAPGTLSFTNADYFTGQEVAVTAPQDANAANESGSVTVSVVPLAPQKSVSVAIADDDRTLVVDVTASGGHVNSTSPPGITNCRVSSGDCTQNYMVNTAVVLEAIPDAGFEFVTFSTLGGGTDCGTTSPATVTMATSLTCVAQFQMLVVP
ncbi:MAG: hypothetical protein ABUL67_02070, partial [Haliangium ochraceum]